MYMKLDVVTSQGGRQLGGRGVSCKKRAFIKSPVLQLLFIVQLLIFSQNYVHMTGFQCGPVHFCDKPHSFSVKK